MDIVNKHTESASKDLWQTRIRTEVLEVCKDGILNLDMLHKIKAVFKTGGSRDVATLPCNSICVKASLANLKPGHVEIPKGVDIWLWACKSSQAYIPFGARVQICPGQSLAMTELQVFAIILSNFNLTTSPNYCHASMCFADRT
ncbi:hypothetical protein CRYUN_Cryun02cG0192200 [Craigia yunnanensis]